MRTGTPCKYIITSQLALERARAIAMTLTYAFLGLTALALLSACDPGHEVTYVNHTSTQIEVFWDNGRDSVVPPGGRVESGLITYSGSRLFRAVGADGHVIFSRDLSWDDLKALDFRIEIAEDATPTPGPTP